VESVVARPSAAAHNSCGLGHVAANRPQFFAFDISGVVKEVCNVDVILTARLFNLFLLLHFAEVHIA